MNIKVHFDNGQFWQTDGSRKVALWTQASCRERIVKLLESLSTNEREAGEQIDEFWTKAVSYIKTKGDDPFEEHEALNNVEILYGEWCEIFGGKTDLVFIC